MLDQEDEATRIGVWVALAVVFVIITGLIGGLVVRQMHARHGAGAAAVVTFTDAPLTGDIAGSVYFYYLYFYAVHCEFVSRLRQVIITTWR